MSGREPRDAPAARQQPEWPDAREVERVQAQLEGLPALVRADETDRLRTQLARVAAGDAFVLQAGDCAESFADLAEHNVHAKLRVLLEMTMVLAYGGGVPVVKVARMAGQYAKPRSSPTERVADGQEIPSFRGHIINSEVPDLNARQPDPRRMLEAYWHAASTLNVIRGASRGQFADVARIGEWLQEFVATSGAGQRFEQLGGEIRRAIRFLSACGFDIDAMGGLHEAELYCGHEALLLDWEEALVREADGRAYGGSGHFLWIGERTRGVDEAHVALLGELANPIGVKLGPDASAGDVVALCERLDPQRQPGRLSLIARLGARRVDDVLSGWVDAVAASGHPVVWICDPMHGNTFATDSGRKTRDFADIVAETRSFFSVLRDRGVWPGGLHLELTGDAVTECVGGGDGPGVDDLPARYETMCDPRLNARQALELAFLVAELLDGT